VQKTIERQIAESLDRSIRGREYGVTRLAGQLEVAPRTVDRWCSAESVPTAADLLRLLREVVLHDPERGMRLADEVLGIVGLWVYRAPRGEAARPGDGVTSNTMELTAATGQLAATVQRALADGRLDHVDAEDIERATVPVLREAHEVRAEAHSVPSPQLDLAGAAQ
jgi:hypothetical protein